MKFGRELIPLEPKTAFFYTYPTGGNIVHDVIMGKACGYHECNAKVKKIAPKYLNFCDDINVPKYTLKLSY